MNFDEDGKCRCPTCSWKPGPIEPAKFGPIVTIKDAVIIGAAVLILLAAIFIGLIVPIHEAFPSDWSACGIKPPPPVACIHCETVCICPASGKCFWVYMKRR